MLSRHRLLWHTWRSLAANEVTTSPFQSFRVRFYLPAATRGAAGRRVQFSNCWYSPAGRVSELLISDPQTCREMAGRVSIVCSRVICLRLKGNLVIVVVKDLMCDAAVLREVQVGTSASTWWWQRDRHRHTVISVYISNLLP